MGKKKSNHRTKYIQGSTLPIAVIIMMLLAIGLVALQTSILSFSARTAVRHYDMQAYLSARSVATAVTEEILDIATRLIATIDPADRASLGITAMPNGSDVNVPASGEIMPLHEVQLLSDMIDMPDGGVLTLTDVKFNDLPTDMKGGDLEATITRNSRSEYEIAVTATVENDVQTVKTVLSAVSYVTGGVAGPDTSVPEVSGNGSVFFADFGFGLKAGGTIDNVGGGVPFISSIPIYSDGTTGQLLDRVESYESIVFEDMPEKTGGSFLSKKDITFTNQNLTNLYIHADGKIEFKDNVSMTNAGIYGETVYVSGNNVRLYAPIIAKTVIIEGTGFQDFQLIHADEIQIVDGAHINGGTSLLNCYTKAGSVFWVDQPYLDGIPQDLIDQARDPSLDVSDQIIEFTGNASISIGMTRATVASTAHTSTDDNYTPVYVELAPRSIPRWADLSARTAEDYDPDIHTIPGQWYGTLTTLETTKYYVLDPDKLPDGKLIFSTSTGDKLEGIDADEDTPIVFKIPDGKEVTIRFEQPYLDYVCIYLEGNAKLNIDRSSSATYCRIYGEPPSVALRNEVRTAAATLAETMMANGDSTGDIQNAINTLIQGTYLNRIAAIKLINDAQLYATFVVPYVYSDDGDLYLRGFLYDNPDDDLQGEDDYDDTTSPPTTTVPDVKLLYADFHSYRE